MSWANRVVNEPARVVPRQRECECRSERAREGHRNVKTLSYRAELFNEINYSRKNGSAVSFSRDAECGLRPIHRVVCTPRFIRSLYLRRLATWRQRSLSLSFFFTSLFNARSGARFLNRAERGKLRNEGESATCFVSCVGDRTARYEEPNKERRGTCD